MTLTFGQVIAETPIVAIMRGSSADALIEAAAALRDGGIPLIEVTLTTPGALRTIEQARDQLGEGVIFGAGSVLDPESARASILAGAQFIVTPTLKVSTIEVCKRYSVPIVCGAYTPTEILTAWEAGADVVKVFPADKLGASYFKGVKAPMPQLKLAAVGGVSMDNAAEYLQSGADALGVGSTLINDKLLAEKDFPEITRRAATLVALCQDARNSI